MPSVGTFLQDRNVALESEVSQLRAEVATLQTRNAVLETELPAARAQRTASEASVHTLIQLLGGRHSNHARDVSAGETLIDSPVPNLSIVAFDESLFPLSGLASNTTHTVGESNGLNRADEVLQDSTKLLETRLTEQEYLFLHQDPNFAACEAEQEAPRRACIPLQAGRDKTIGESHEQGAPNGHKGSMVGRDDDLGIPRWAHHTEVFASSFERQMAIRIHTLCESGSRDAVPPDFFRFGIRFIPNTGEQEHRTILVTNLPRSITMRALLGRVRGGAVVSAILLNSITITGSVSAMIAFRLADDAEEYTKYRRRYPMRFAGQITQVRVLSTPTWPLSLGLQKAIDEYGYTRCLEISNFPCNLRRTLKSDLRPHYALVNNTVECFERRRGGALQIRFSSISQAGRAYRLLTSKLPYRDFEMKFVADPCALPLEGASAPASEEGSVSVISKGALRGVGWEGLVHGSDGDDEDDEDE